jgi:hypothetical protein
MAEVNCGTRALDAYTRLMDLFNAPRLANLTDIDQMDKDDYREIATQLQDLFWYIKDSVESHPMVAVYAKYHTNFVSTDAEHALAVAGVHGLHSYLKATQFYVFTNESMICRWASLNHIIQWITWQYCDYKKNRIYDTAFEDYAMRNLKMALENGAALTEKYTSFHIKDDTLCAFPRESMVSIF